VRLPLASVPTGSVRHLGFMRHCVGMANVGVVPPAYPLLYGVAREGPTGARTTGTPDQGVNGDPSINRRSYS
jgi:hypothetical protein